MSEKTKAALPFSTQNPDGSVAVKLKEPITFGEELIETLTFIKPKAKHMKNLNIKDMKMSDMLALMSVLSGQFPQALDELGMHDLIFCSGVLEGFLPNMSGDGKMA